MPQGERQLRPDGGYGSRGRRYLHALGFQYGGGTAATVAVITIPAAIAARGGAILSTTLPSRGYRYLTTVWAGLTGGLLTDGVDCGISDGSLALDADA